MADLEMPDFMELMEAGEKEAQKDRYITFRSGKEYFGLKIQYVDEIIVYQDITPVPETEDYIKGLINLRGKIIPVIDVRIRFGQDPIPYTDRTCIIVIQVGEDVVGLIVEKIAEVVEIPEKDVLSEPEVPKGDIRKNRFIYGIGRGDGKVKFLLDPEKLIRDSNPGTVGKKKGERSSEGGTDKKSEKSPGVESKGAEVPGGEPEKKGKASEDEKSKREKSPESESEMKEISENEGQGNEIGKNQFII